MPRKKSATTISPPPPPQAPSVQSEASDGPKITKSQAKEIVGQITGHMLKAGDHLRDARALLLELRDSQGWKSLGWRTWEECLEGEFEASRSYLYRQLKAAEIERELSPIGDTGQIPESQLRPLAKLPEGTRAEAWEEAKEATNGKPTAKAVEQVVNQRLNGKKTVTIEPPDFSVGDIVTGKSPDSDVGFKGKIFQFVERGGKPCVLLVDLKQDLPVGHVTIDSLALVEPAPAPEPIILPRKAQPFSIGDKVVVDDGLGEKLFGEILEIDTDQEVARVLVDDDDNAYRAWVDLDCLTYAQEKAPELQAPIPDRPLAVGDWIETRNGDQGEVIKVEGVTALVEILDTKGERQQACWFDIDHLAPRDRPLAVGDWVNSKYTGIAQIFEIKKDAALVKTVSGGESWMSMRYLEKTDPPTQAAEPICQDCKHYQVDYEGYPDYCTWFSEEIEPGEGGCAANCEKYQPYQEVVDPSQEHYTPDHIQEAVIQVLGEIDLDPCSNSKEQPNIRAGRHFVRRDDGLCRTWSGKVYLNPPYSPNGTIAHWIQKLVDEYDECEITEAIALVPASTDTQWFKLFRGYPICFLEGRLKFKNPTNESPAPFPSAIVYLGENRTRFFEVFGGLGDIRISVTSGGEQ